MSISQKILMSTLLIIGIVTNGCSNKVEKKPKTEVLNGKVSQNIEIGKQLADFSFKNQFDKEVSLKSTTKKIIFVFTKPTGHLVKQYLSSKAKGFLEKRDIIFIADVSGMPSIIFKMFALPDFQKSSYSVLLIKDKEKSKRFRNEAHKDEVMIISLDNKKVKSVKFISTEKDLKEEIGE